MQIFINSGGQQSGPFSLDQINQNLQLGAISPDAAMAWYEGLAGWIPLRQVPGVVPLGPAFGPPPVPPPSARGGDATGGVIPYKNPPALIAYYLGIFSLIPLLGFFLGIASIILGIVGLRKRSRNPVIKGSVHAWIGIIMGILVIGGHLLMVALITVGTRSH